MQFCIFLFPTNALFSAESLFSLTRRSRVKIGFVDGVDLQSMQIQETQTARRRGRRMKIEKKEVFGAGANEGIRCYIAYC